MTNQNRRQVQVGDPSEYDGRFAIVCNDHPRYGWSVPAWEERGHGDLAGPFVTLAEARGVLAMNREYLELCGYAVVL